MTLLFSSSGNRQVGSIFKFGLLFVIAFQFTALQVPARADTAVQWWERFHHDPEPASLGTFRQKLDAHLARAERSLAVLTFVCKQYEKGWPDRRLKSQDCLQRIKNAHEFIRSSQEVWPSNTTVCSADDLVDQLKVAEQIAGQMADGESRTKEMLAKLQSARGIIKMALYRLQAAEPEAAVVEGSQPVPERTRYIRPAIIADAGDSTPPAEAYLNFPIATALWQLGIMTGEQRTRFTQMIIEDENTRVIEAHAVGPNSEDCYLLLSKRIELPNGDIHTVQLPFYVRVEKTGTQGLWDILRLATGTNDDAGLRIRNTLMTEVPITQDLSISACETCVSLFPSRDPNRPGQTVVQFSADMELTFYRHVTGRIRDISFRSVATAKTRGSLEQIKQRGALRTSQELARIISVNSLTPVSTGRTTLAGDRSEISPADPIASEAP